MSETLAKASLHVENTLLDRFDVACERMQAHNEGYTIDNPQAIAEELNTLMPWIDEDGIEFIVDEGKVIGLMDDDDPYDFDVQ
jgi:hypothetical protein